MKTSRRAAALATLVLSLAAPSTVPGAPGDLDAAFDALMQHNVATDSMGPDTATVLPDGKLLVGGFFFADTTPPRKWLMRVNANGALDASFDPQTDGGANTIAVQPDGKIVITGGFFTVAGMTRSFIARLNADGTLDTGFDPKPNSFVYGAAVQADGKILLWGKFTALQPNGAATPTPRFVIARVNADDTLDPDFTPYVNDFQLQCLVPQPDGKVLVGGSFSQIRPAGAAIYVQKQCLARLNSDGTLDESFDPRPDGEVTNIIVRPDGKILIGGYFESLQPNGAPTPIARSRMALLNPDGTLDPGFVPDPSVPYAGASLALQADGKVILGEIYTPALGFQVVRLNADGSLGAGFLPRPQAGRYVNGVDLQADGKVLLSGTFDTLQPNDAPAPITRAKLARLLNDPATQTLTVADAAHVQWQRGGTAPQVSRTLFELSTNGGANWTPLGTGTWVPANGRWEMSGLALPRSGLIRARGVTNGGFHNNSYGLVEQVQAFDFPPTPGDLDSLNADIDQSIGSGGSGIDAIAVQPDGQIVFGGLFQSVLGASRRGAARLHADGTLDAGFDLQGNGSAESVTVQSDGKIIVTNITPVQGVNRNGLARINADGTLDAGFDPNARYMVLGTAAQADGKVLLWGGFETLQPNGAPAPTTRRFVARVNGDGTLDPGFDPGPNGQVYAAAVQADGKVLLCGQFSGFRPNGGSDTFFHPSFARLNADGTLDGDFNPVLNVYPYGVAVQPDGKIVVFGDGMARLNTDGTVDAGFIDPKANKPIRSVALQADGRMFIGGDFTTLQPNGGVAVLTHRGLARLNADGTLDAGFDPKPDGDVYAVAIQGDGKVLAGGTFFTFQPNGVPTPVTRAKLARLENDAATQTLSAPDATQVQWQRGGTAPELIRAVFELSTDGGGSWTVLGAAVRVGATANWGLAGLTLPTAGQIRARGVTTGGGTYNGSSSVIEQVAAFTFPIPSPLQQWKLAHLGDANADDLGDPDSDGLATLAEYGLDLHPETSDTAPISGVFQYLDGKRLGIIVHRNPAHTDVTVEVQAADFPGGPWTTVATSAFGAPFAGPGFVHEELENSGGLTVEVSDTVNVDDATQRFLRVRVTR